MAKTNCADCLSGSCRKCVDENCLCRESHKFCRNCKEKDAVGSFLQDFCSHECQYDWYLENKKAVDEPYNDTAKLGIVQHFLNKKKSYRELIYHLKTNVETNFPFNPMENDLIMEFYLENPEEFIPLIRAAIIESFKKFNPNANENQLRENLSVYLTESTEIKMNQWGAEYEGYPVEVTCQVVGQGIAETYLKQGEAVCSSCGSKKPMLSLGILPDCTNNDCERKYKPMNPVQKSIRTGDIKIIQIQEPMEQTKHGSPTTLTCVIKDEYVKSTYIGQNKKLIGVFRSQAQKGKMTNKALIHVISMENLGDIKEEEPTEEDIAFFKKMSKKQNFLEILSESISPEIIHETLAKTCVLLSLVSGTTIGRLRGDIHTFLVGNPGDGKTSILMFILEIVIKSAFVNGSSMSGSGVTATMDTLPDKQKIVRAGAIPRCSGGTVACDEMNQLEPEELGKMFEGMETGKIHYDKGGLTATLDARTGIVGAANPKNYEYDWDKSMVTNLSFMPPPMISRFDLIVNMAIEKTEQQKDDISDHIIRIRNHGVDQYVEEAGLFTARQLKLFLTHVKKEKPELNSKASELLKNFQKLMQKVQVENKGMRRIDNRFFEAMIRIATALAKIHMSKEVTETHAMLAIEIYKQTLHTFKIDTTSGITLPKMQKFVTGKKSAFETYCQKLMSCTTDQRFTEVECLDGLMEMYPDYFPTKALAQKMFDDYYNEGRLGKQGGRYRLE